VDDLNRLESLFLTGENIFQPETTIN